jgi:hypothetical protein
MPWLAMFADTAVQPTPDQLTYCAVFLAHSPTALVMWYCPCRP